MIHHTEEEQPLLSMQHVGMYYWLKGGLFKRRVYWALKDVSFDLYRGDSLGVVGRNGVGKTTLLRILAGVMSPDKGVFINNGVSVSLLTLSLGFLDYLSGRENAILGGMFLGMKKRDIESRLDDILAFSELGDFFEQPISTYSSGMRSRLAFAVAFQVEPDVLLVDEVTGVGDIAFREKSFHAMNERIRSHESTIVFVSHHALQVRRMCNRAVWIENGVVKASGETEEVLQQYESTLPDSAKHL